MTIVTFFLNVVISLICTATAALVLNQSFDPYIFIGALLGTFFYDAWKNR